MRQGEHKETKQTKKDCTDEMKRDVSSHSKIQNTADDSFKITAIQYSVNVGYCSKPFNFYWLSKNTASFYSWKKIFMQQGAPVATMKGLASESTELSFLAK